LVHQVYQVHSQAPHPRHSRATAAITKISKNHHVFSEWTKDVRLVVLYCVSDKENTVKRGVKNEKI
jgi:hypothetical protein